MMKQPVHQILNAGKKGHTLNTIAPGINRNHKTYLEKGTVTTGRTHTRGQNWANLGLEVNETKKTHDFDGYIDPNSGTMLHYVRRMVKDVLKGFAAKKCIKLGKLLMQIGVIDL
ncbi:hypothetical protein CTI12_AA399920 [Artemisia annua]|uniref:Uncharacterized protein n=1 Tax=Artemisia annua TaxID=35608 RepID=A0A2U1MB14_ARTAN|nr:hypothetical protein CTI12_AA399920 [Artemisia annua]